MATTKVNVVTLDWLAVTFKGCSPQEVIESILQMELEQFSLEKWGINKYQFHYACCDIKVYFNEKKGDENMGVFFQLSGSGCGQYEEYLNGNLNNWVELVQRCIDFHGNFTRLDIANDIYDESLNVLSMYKYSKKGLCISSAKKSTYYDTYMLDTGVTVGETIEIGKRGGDGQQFCVYNKLFEQRANGILEGTKDIESWMRAELRLFGKKAKLIANQIILKRPLADIFFESVNGHYRFVVDSDMSNDNQVRRRPMVDWWAKYIGTSEKVVLSIERRKTTMEDSKMWLDKQASKTLCKLYMAEKAVNGEEGARAYIEYLLIEGYNRFSDNDKAEIQQYVQEKKSGETWGIDRKVV